MFYEKTGNNFLNNEQKTIYAEKRVNNSLNNAEQKINFCRMLEKVNAENCEEIFVGKRWTVLINAENKIYDCRKQIWIYSKHDVQRANFIIVETDFINEE